MRKQYDFKNASNNPYVESLERPRPLWELSVGEPWDFVGPDGANRVLATPRGRVRGPAENNWSEYYLLLDVVHPFEVGDERVVQLIVAPLYGRDTLEDIEIKGGTVGVARVRPGVVLNVGGTFIESDVVYCIIGGLRPAGDQLASRG